MRWIIALLMLATIASAQYIDVHFGDVECETLETDSATIAVMAIDTSEVEVIMGTYSIDDLLMMVNNPFIRPYAGNSTNIIIFTDPGLEMSMMFKELHPDSAVGVFAGDLMWYIMPRMEYFAIGDRNYETLFRIDSCGTAMFYDTLAVGTEIPEYFFHVANDGIYSLFEGNNDGKTYVAVDNNHATHECGFSIWRQGTEMWTVEDSNGTFIIYDSDSNQNAIMINGTTQNVTIPKDLGVTGTMTGTVNATDGISTTNFIIAVGDTITVVNGIVTKLTH